MEPQIDLYRPNSLNRLNREVWEIRWEGGAKIPFWYNFLICCSLLAVAFSGHTFILCGYVLKSDRLALVCVSLMVIIFVGLIYYYYYDKNKWRRDCRERCSQYQKVCKRYAEYLNMRYSGFDPQGQRTGEKVMEKVIYDSFQGQLQLYKVKIEDYSLRVESDSGDCYTYYTVAIMATNFKTYDLIIKPKKLNGYCAVKGQKLERFEFESTSFNRAFEAWGNNQKFAFDIINPRMMDYLLKHQWYFIDINKDSIISVHTSGFLLKAEIPVLLGFVEGFLERIPRYVKRFHVM